MELNTTESERRRRRSRVNIETGNNIGRKEEKNREETKKLRRLGKRRK